MRYITVLAATVAGLTATPTALAQMATWDGGQGNWTDPNWMINGMLTTIPNGAQVTANIPEGWACLDPGMSFNVGGVTLTGSGFLCGSGQLTISGGLIQSAGALGADITLTGQGSVWTGGSWGSRSNRSTTVAPGAALQISVSGDANMERRTLTNNGAVTHLNGRVTGNVANPGGGHAATAIINNGAWLESTVFALEFFPPDPTHTWAFTNNGTFTKQGSGLTVFTRVRFDNTGSVDVQEGTLNLNHGGTSGSTALFNAEPGAAINFGGGIYTANGSTFTGGGQFTATSGFRMTGTIEASNLTFDGATIGGTHTLSGPNFLWTGDNIGAGAEDTSTILTPATSLEIDVTGTVNLARRTLTNNGAVMHRGGRIDGAGGAFLTSIINNGAWTESAAVALEFFISQDFWTYTNNGTFTKQGSGLTVFTRVRFDNTGSVDVQEGTLNFAGTFRQTAGEMVLSGGGVAGALTFTGGSLRGSGDLAGNVTMTGATLDPGLSSGLLSFGANLVLNGASVPIQLEGTARGTTYDAIDVAGSLSLGGSTLQLNVTLLDPATPIGTEFLIFNKASAPAIGGTFGGLSQGARFNSGIFEFEITYLGGDGNDVVLTVTDSSFCPCACDFDTSTGQGVCDLIDFTTFAGLFAIGDPCACDLDTSTGQGVCDLIDFTTFAGQFAAGCP